MTFDAEDVWWERVFEITQDLADLRGCDRHRCLSYVCECRREAIVSATQEIGRCYDDERPGSPATGTGNGAGFYGVPFDDD